MNLPGCVASAMICVVAVRVVYGPVCPGQVDLMTGPLVYIHE